MSYQSLEIHWHQCVVFIHWAFVPQGLPLKPQLIGWDISVCKFGQSQTFGMAYKGYKNSHFWCQHWITSCSMPKSAKTQSYRTKYISSFIIYNYQIICNCEANLRLERYLIVEKQLKYVFHPSRTMNHLYIHRNIDFYTLLSILLHYDRQVQILYIKKKKEIERLRSGKEFIKINMQ